MLVQEHTKIVDKVLTLISKICIMKKEAINPSKHIHIQKKQTFYSHDNFNTG
jgi:hypothetical protein